MNILKIAIVGGALLVAFFILYPQLSKMGKGEGEGGGIYGGAPYGAGVTEKTPTMFEIIVKQEPIQIQLQYPSKETIRLEEPQEKYYPAPEETGKFTTVFTPQAAPFLYPSTLESPVLKQIFGTTGQWGQYGQAVQPQPYAAGTERSLAPSTLEAVRSKVRQMQGDSGNGKRNGEGYVSREPGTATTAAALQAAGYSGAAAAAAAGQTVTASPGGGYIY